MLTQLAVAGLALPAGSCIRRYVIPESAQPRRHPGKRAAKTSSRKLRSKSNVIPEFAQQQRRHPGICAATATSSRNLRSKSNVIPEFAQQERRHPGICAANIRDPPTSRLVNPR